MSTNLPQHNPNDQEIDLSQIFKKIGGLFQDFNTFLFRCIQFFIKNGIAIIILLIIGFGLGFYLDKNQKTYNHQIIVAPNFESTNYLYSKIDLIESKISERDTLFLREVVGIKRPKELKEIKIKPIIDISKFVEDKPENIELVKLMTEDGDVKKILEDNLISKNYKFQTIYFTTDKLIDNNDLVQPLLNFLNDTDYYKQIQKEAVNNIQIEMRHNDTIISQINGVLNGFSNSVNSLAKNDKLIYYNENTQLNDLIKTKNNLIIDQGKYRVDLVGFDKIVKDVSISTNSVNRDLTFGNLKLFLPILFVLGFILVRFFAAFYKKQSLKAQQIDA
ncbi:MAG TPA: hypothetical protein VIH02_02000 [Flavobacterium sp.]